MSQYAAICLNMPHDQRAKCWDIADRDMFHTERVYVDIEHMGKGLRVQTKRVYVRRRT